MKPSLWLLLSCVVFIPGCSGCSKQESDRVRSEQESATEHQNQPDSSQEQTNETAESTSNNGTTESDPGEKTNEEVGANNERRSDDSNVQKATASESNGNGGPKGRMGVTDGVGGGNGRTGKSSPGKSSNVQGPHDPVEAVEMANGYRHRSEQAAENENYGDAFDLAVQAWEMTQAFPEDPECQKLEGELQKLIDQFGDQANRENRSSLRKNQPLIVQ